MKSSSLIGHVVELLELLPGSSLPADALIGRFFRDRRYLGARDRRFIAETFYGVLRHLRLCDHTLARSGGLLEGATGEGRSLFRVAAYRLVIDPMDTVRVPDFLEVVGEDDERPRFEEALRGLTSPGRMELDDLAPELRWSFSDWMTERLKEQYGEATLAPLLTSLNEPAPVSLRVNTLKTSPEDCAKRLREEDVDSVPGRLVQTSLMLKRRMNAFSLKAFRDGLFEVQDEGSQFLAALADPKPTDRVLDMCAGAGGKTLAFSASMKNRGEIVAADVSAFKLKELRKRMRRAGAGNIRINERFFQGTSDETFHLVLVDAPCSGVGTIRRNPGMKWSVTPEMVVELSEKQRGILARASGHVRDGGLLVYATCSLFREENEEIVERFLTEHPAFSVESPAEKIPAEGAHTIGPDGYVRLFPHVDNTDGFFVALLRKRKE